MPRCCWSSRTPTGSTRPTADVLAFVARRIESDPIILLAATRDGYPSALAEAGLPEHRLVGLDDTTAAALLDAAAPTLSRRARTACCVKRPVTRSRSSSCRPWPVDPTTSHRCRAACR